MVKNRYSVRPKSSSGPYANIQWEKAVSLFVNNPSEVTSGRYFPSVKQTLFKLAKAGADGLIFLFESEKRGIEFMHPGINLESPLDWQMKQLFRQLNKQHFVKVKKNIDGTVTVKILKKGMIKAITYKLDMMRLKPSERWDKKWRLVIFDIPNKYKKVRDLFRKRLCQLELYPLQESVYISPYACFDEVEFLRELYGVAFTVKYLLVEKVEDDIFLKTHFHLS
ncbi:hypothetical protein KKB64_02420 [Patescibacteria group bacterium]|nr:hypothetical protein [Patescibacteria group bacterium]MBU1472621.1 hypothetical protein [Patescibacteria group bacterium]MBU2459609.1 hypothetical protein [Patescibacteria group bacterium]MBU2544067.1 hypothetical protein [Patescibacteria group bacterium]